MGKKILEKVFARMEDMGWTLDDFKDVYEVHKAFLNGVLEKFENDEIEEDELVWCAQFMTDFLDCLEQLTAKEIMK